MSPRERHAMFGDTEVDDEGLKLALFKSFEGHPVVMPVGSSQGQEVKAVCGQMERSIKVLLTLSSSKNPL